jgi:hypothetical protein
MQSFGPVVFVAVGPGGSVQKVSGCELTWKRGLGRYGLIFSTKEVFTLNLESFKRQSIAQLVNNSQLSPEDLDQRLSKILETWGYTVGEGPTRDGLLVRYTPQYNDRPGLCDESCRAVDIHKEVAFVVTIEILAGPPRQWAYEVRVMPSVLMRYQREGGEFKPDPDGVQSALVQ